MRGQVPGAGRTALGTNLDSMPAAPFFGHLRCCLHRIQQRRESEKTAKVRAFPTLTIVKPAVYVISIPRSGSCRKIDCVCHHTSEELL
jgi:hypothetical protein